MRARGYELVQRQRREISWYIKSYSSWKFPQKIFIAVNKSIREVLKGICFCLWPPPHQDPNVEFSLLRTSGKHLMLTMSHNIIIHVNEQFHQKWKISFKFTYMADSKGVQSKKYYGILPSVYLYLYFGISFQAIPIKKIFRDLPLGVPVAHLHPLAGGFTPHLQKYLFLHLIICIFIYICIFVYDLHLTCKYQNILWV